MNEVILRTKTTIWHYQKTDDRGHLYHRSDNKKGMYVPDSLLQEFIAGNQFKVDMKGITGTFYVDWSLRDQRIALQKREEEEVRIREEGKKEMQMINEMISDDDVDVLNYREYLFKSHGKTVPVMDVHKQFIYAIRTKDVNHLKSWLGHGKGWNDVSKQFFSIMTGVKLPKTKKGILETLKQWGNDESMAV